MMACQFFQLTEMSWVVGGGGRPWSRNFATF
jgi:hypothetical protein